MLKWNINLLRISLQNITISLVKAQVLQKILYRITIYIIIIIYSIYYNSNIVDNLL